MGRFEDYAKEAQKKGTAESLDSTFWKPEGKGDVRIGILAEKFEVQSSVSEGTYNQYLVDTDAGMVKFALGSAGDKEYGERLAYGELYVFEFDGKESLPGGKTVNKWKISHIPREAQRTTPVRE